MQPVCQISGPHRLALHFVTGAFHASFGRSDSVGQSTSLCGNGSTDTWGADGFLVSFGRVSRTAAATLVLAAFGSAASADEVNGLAPATAPEAPTKGSPLTLLVVAPTGAHYRLAFVAGQGWTFIDPIPSADLAKVASNGAVPPSDGMRGDQPLSVFIDGPTGYTFAWSTERGWHFIGHVVNGDR